jgi:hypothetical protein
MLAGTPKISEIDKDLAHVSPELRAVVRKATDVSEPSRFQDASELSMALRDFLKATGVTLLPAVRAVCSNLTCAGANWSSNGYYRGPGIFEECTDAFCQHCGLKLARHCPRCTAPFLGTPFLRYVRRRMVSRQRAKPSIACRERRAARPRFATDAALAIARLALLKPGMLGGPRMYGGHSRIEAGTEGSVTTVTVAPARNPVSAVFGLIALTWCLGGLSFGINVLRSSTLPSLGPKVFFVLWVLFAVAIAVVASFNLVWNLFGFWQTAFDTEKLTVTMRLGRLARAQSYSLADVQNVRISERRGRGTLVMRTIAFDYRGKTCYATPRLSRGEAGVLLEGPFQPLTQQAVS